MPTSPIARACRGGSRPLRPSWSGGPGHAHRAALLAGVSGSSPRPCLHAELEVLRGRGQEERLRLAPLPVRRTSRRPGSATARAEPSRPAPTKRCWERRTDLPSSTIMALTTGTPGWSRNVAIGFAHVLPEAFDSAPPEVGRGGVPHLVGGEVVADPLAEDVGARARPRTFPARPRPSGRPARPRPAAGCPSPPPAGGWRAWSGARRCSWPSGRLRPIASRPPSP